MNEAQRFIYAIGVFGFLWFVVRWLGGMQLCVAVLELTAKLFIRRLQLRYLSFKVRRLTAESQKLIAQAGNLNPIGKWEDGK